VESVQIFPLLREQEQARNERDRLKQIRMFAQAVKVSVQIPCVASAATIVKIPAESPRRRSG